MANITWSLPVEAADWLRLKVAEHGLSIEALLRKSVASFIAHQLSDPCEELQQRTGAAVPRVLQ
jgi:hypothetical protein